MIGRIVLILSLAASFGCAARAYRPPQWNAIEVRGATITEERENRGTFHCQVGDWIYDAERKMWIGVCR